MAQTNWSLLGTPAQQIVNHSVGRNADGRLEVFYSDVNNEIWHIWQTAPNGTWSTSALLNKLANASYYSSIAVDENADGRLEVFTIADGALWHIWQTTAGGNWYNTWFSSGKPSGMDLQPSPALVRNADGRLEVFAAGTDGALWHIWQTAPNGTWSSWASLGTPSNVQFLSGYTVGKNADGRLEVFTVGSDGALWHIWQTTAGGNWYNTWFSSGKLSTSAEIYIGPAVIQNADGRLEVFTVGSDGALWHIWQNSPNGTWNTWTSFGTIPNVQFTTAGPAVGKNKDGRLEVLIAGNDGALWHTWQVTPGKNWNNWDSLGALPSTNLSTAPEVSENSDGRLEVFVASGDRLWHAWQVTPGSWG